MLGVVVVFLALRSLQLHRDREGNEIITLERRWFRRSGLDGRTVALSNRSVFKRARPRRSPADSVHLPYAKHQLPSSSAPTKVGLVQAVFWSFHSVGRIFLAKPVACSLFQDGEAIFFAAAEKKGPQVLILPPE